MSKHQTAFIAYKQQRIKIPAGQNINLQNQYPPTQQGANIKSDWTNTFQNNRDI